MWWEAGQPEPEQDLNENEDENEDEDQDQDEGEGDDADCAPHRTNAHTGEEAEYRYMTPGEWALDRGWAAIDSAQLGHRVRAKDVAAERRQLRDHVWMTGKNGEHISLLTADGQYIDMLTFRCGMQGTNTCCEMLSLLDKWGVVKIVV